MKDFHLTNHNLDSLMYELKAELEEKPILIVSTQSANTGKWGMSRLWRAWMSTTAKFMADSGCVMPLMVKADGSQYGSRPFNADDAHELFTRQWLGVDEDGYRLSWAKSGKQRKATKGERFNALRQHENWCVEKGINLLKPRDSEYEKLRQEQEV